ncbi:hypothetical protein EET67_22530 [Pseudaminobacter arsenicus]|uniref:Uncharacterized protein n=1 Tax=Borborobacter arsenicus TaxID=1851146 RepID=A0A432V041_9HYPH|nr:hypothetical protein [Pseudaminobacter arsenicus]RUM95543.1 hypothetical protein EET67_22530 [Pseudaminobacter arsenicus]
MQDPRPAAPAVLETLEKLLTSETFGRSGRARDLLRYLVEQEQAGHADRLKGFTIAIDVFGKDADFDPATDAVVRVQARRLRELLAQYFQTEGANDPIRISIPRGSYVPAYEIIDCALAGTHEDGGQEISAPQVAPAPSPQAPTPAAGRPIPEPASTGNGEPLSLPPNPLVMRHLHLFWAAMAVIIAMLAFVVFRLASPAPGDVLLAARDAAGPATNSISASPATETLPVVYVETRSEDQNTMQVAALLRSGLSGFDTISAIARGAPEQPAPGTQQFVFTLSPATASGAVTVELQASASGKMLLSQVLSATDMAPEVLEDRVAALLSSTIPVSGALYGYIDQGDLGSGLVECLLLNDNYYLDPTRAKHEAAYRCFEALAKGDAKSPLVYAELGALHLEAATNRHPYPEHATEEQALALARRGVKMGPTSPYAHRAMGFIASRMGNSAESIAWMRKAYELNTYDLSMAAAYGYALIYSGKYDEGTPIMERAVDASSAHPAWWDYALFLAEFMNGDRERASRATAALVTTKRANYLGARLIAAHWADKAELAKELLAEIRNDHPSFAADPRATFERGRYPAELTDRLVEALREAGLDRPSD